MTRTKDIRGNIKDTKEHVKKRDAINLELNHFDRMISHLGANSKKCSECKRLYTEVEDYFEVLKEKEYHLNRKDKKTSKVLTDTIIKHLHKEHNLFRQGYYMSIFIPMGTSIGIVVGLIFFEKIIMPSVLGLTLGLLIGVVLDATVKKYNRTI
jgi:F0F1-type ATP synthase assembly protein I